MTICPSSEFCCATDNARRSRSDPDGDPDGAVFERNFGPGEKQPIQHWIFPSKSRLGRRLKAFVWNILGQHMATTFMPLATGDGPTPPLFFPGSGLGTANLTLSEEAFCPMRIVIGSIDYLVVAVHSQLCLLGNSFWQYVRSCLVCWWWWPSWRWWVGCFVRPPSVQG